MNREVISMSSSNPLVEAKKRILVIDDEPDVTLFFKMALEDAGFLVDVLNDPLTALLRFRSKTYDLLLIDIRMPRLNGFDLFKRLIKKDPDVKVCFVTAFESYYQAIKEEHPTLNAKCFLKKPIKADELSQIVKKLVNIPIKSNI
jgi:DNA-binding NtrC family response regulator